MNEARLALSDGDHRGVEFALPNVGHEQAAIYAQILQGMGVGVGVVVCGRGEAGLNDITSRCTSLAIALSVVLKQNLHAMPQRA